MSEYDILEKEWTKHFVYNAKVLKVFKHCDKPAENEYLIGVLTENQMIHMLKSKESKKSDIKIFRSEEENEIYKLPGMVVDIDR